jgi:hypothetical protein
MDNNNANEQGHMDEHLLDLSTENRPNNQKVKPIVIYGVTEELKNDQDKQAALYKEWGVLDDIQYIKLDKNNNLLVFAKNVSKAEELYKNSIFFHGLKKRNLNSFENLPAAIIKDNIRFDELNEHVAYIKTLGVVEAIELEPRSRRLYKDAAVSKRTTIKLFFRSEEERDALVYSGLRIKLRIYKLETCVRVLQCLKCKRFGHTESKCSDPRRCARCSLEGDNHEESSCSNSFKCANCKKDHSAFDRFCQEYLNHKKDQLVEHKSKKLQQTVSLHGNSEPPKGMTRLFSDMAKLTPNNNSALIDLLKQQEANRKSDFSEFKNEMFKFFDEKTEKVYERIDNLDIKLQNSIAQTNHNTGTALHEVLSRVFPEKSASISQAVNEAYQRHNLSILNTQPFPTLIQVQQPSHHGGILISPNQTTGQANTNKPFNINLPPNQIILSNGVVTQSVQQQQQPHVPTQHQQQFNLLNSHNNFNPTSQ